METIQVILDTDLLKASDFAAKRQKMSRSAFIRHALEEHLKRLAEPDLEEQDRRGYTTRPQREEEYQPWEDAAVWPQPGSTAMCASFGSQSAQSAASSNSDA